MAKHHGLGVLLLIVLFLNLSPKATAATDDVCVLSNPPFTFQMLCLVTNATPRIEVAATGLQVVGYAALVNIHINAGVGPQPDLTVAGFGATSPCDEWNSIRGVESCGVNGQVTTLYAPDAFGTPTLCTVQRNVTIFVYDHDETRPHWGANNVTAIGSC